MIISKNFCILKIILTFTANDCTIILGIYYGVRTLKCTVLHRVICVFTAAVLVILSGCGNKKGNADDNTVQQVSGTASDAAVIERDFIGADVSTPEYIGGVKLVSENGNVGIKLKNFSNASVYCYDLDRQFYSIEKPLTSAEVSKKYVNDLEKKFGVKFNLSSEFSSDVYYSNLSTKSGTVGIAICNGNFDEGFNGVLSVAVKLPAGSESPALSSDKDKNKTSSDTDGKNDSSSGGDISGYWKAAYYLADNGNTVRTDTYSIFAYNSGSASLYIDYERYEGNWKAKDKGFEFSFVGLHGYGEMAKINGGEYLLVKFDEVDGKIAFENLY